MISLPPGLFIKGSNIQGTEIPLRKSILDIYYKGALLMVSRNNKLL